MAIWYFISGLFRNIYIGVMTVFGRIRIYRHFPWFAYDPTGYQVKSVQIRKALKHLEPGDVVCRYYTGFLDGCFIPGRFSHSGIYVGKDPYTGAELIIHALGTGVQKIDVLDFLRCDGFAILRPNDRTDADGVRVTDKAVKLAYQYLGYDYDFFFDICADYRNKAEVQKRTRSVYCHELTRSCFPDLDVPTVQPVLWRGMIRSKKRQFLAQSFFDSPDFTLFYDSDYSEARCDQK